MKGPGVHSRSTEAPRTYSPHRTVPYRTSAVSVWGSLPQGPSTRPAGRGDLRLQQTLGGSGHQVRVDTAARPTSSVLTCSVPLVKGDPYRATRAKLPERGAVKRGQVPGSVLARPGWKVPRLKSPLTALAAAWNRAGTDRTSAPSRTPLRRQRTLS